MKKISSLIIFLLSLILIVRCENILYLSNVISPSHFIWFRSILTSLHERGHNITALSPDVEKSFENFTYLHLEKVYPAFYNDSHEINYFEMGQKSVIEQFTEFIYLGQNVCNATLHSDGYKYLLNYPDNFKFDLVFYDFIIGPCLLGMVDRFGQPPTIAATAFNGISILAPMSGTLIYPAFVPGTDLQYPAEMNFQQRVSSTAMHLFNFFMTKFFVPPIENMVRKVHPNVPSLDIIQRRSKMFFMNSNPITDFKEPVFPNVKLVGGAQISKPKELPAALKEIADEAKNGLILFSLGTNVRSDMLGSDRITKILKAFGRLPNYNFFWKLESSENLPVELPKNVKIQAWMPQNDVLAHPNTKLFISHCGLLSTQEAMWYGVPVLGFPIFADQPDNIHRLKELGLGERLDIHEFTENELYEDIKNMIKNPKYQKSAKKISIALQDQPMTPLEEATYWSEWLMRNPNIDLQGPASNLNLFVRHSLDVYTAFLIIVLIISLIWLKVICFLMKRFVFAGKKSQINIKKKNN